MEQKPYTPNLEHPPPPKAPREMNDQELDEACRVHGFHEHFQQERQHRELRCRVDSLVSGQAELKDAMDRLARPHWVLWATLIATAVAAIAGVILLFRP
jgi:hypothetical protein